MAKSTSPVEVAQNEVNLAFAAMGEAKNKFHRGEATWESFMASIDELSAANKALQQAQQIEGSTTLVFTPVVSKPITFTPVEDGLGSEVLLADERPEPLGVDDLVMRLSDGQAVSIDDPALEVPHDDDNAVTLSGDAQVPEGIVSPPSPVDDGEIDLSTIDPEQKMYGVGNDGIFRQRPEQK